MKSQEKKKKKDHKKREKKKGEKKDFVSLVSLGKNQK